MAGHDFALALAEGQAGESVIARWFRSRGFYVLPVYETEKDSDKAPRLFEPASRGSLIAPDLFVFRRLNDASAHAYWIEAKKKTALPFAYYWQLSYARREASNGCNGQMGGSNERGRDAGASENG